MSLRNHTKQALLTFLLSAIAVLSVYAWLMHKQGLSIEPVALESRGREIWETLHQLDEPNRHLLPRDGTTNQPPQNSADYFNWLADMPATDESNPETNPLRDLQRVLNMSRRGQGKFTASDTPWIIAKNLPEEIPGHFIVMATANVDAETLRARLSAHDMDKRISVTFDSPIRALREHAILIRGDGRTIKFSKRRTPPGNYACREVYDNLPFDMATNPATGFPVKYLTPDGEKSPGQ